uniref:Uncharacterized protein n=1 Tax=Photinus pyralis TaxID=7054 RepID=A0A1Y1KR58_PHOPY
MPRPNLKDIAKSITEATGTHSDTSTLNPLDCNVKYIASINTEKPVITLETIRSIFLPILSTSADASKADANIRIEYTMAMLLEAVSVSPSIECRFMTITL